MANWTTMAALLASTMQLSACATTVLSVQPVTPVNIEGDAVDGGAEPGIRYSLPVPFLLMMPSAAGDGSFAMDVVYLPDESRTYAIDAQTKRGKYELQAELNHGLLKKLLWKQTDAALAAESTRAAGEVAKTRLQQQVDEKAKRDTKNEDAKKAADTKVETLATALSEKSVALAIAEATRDAAIAATSAEADAARKKELLVKQQAAELDVTKARIERDAARDRLAAARRAAIGLGSIANVPGVPGASASTPAANAFHGPVLYRIIDERGKPVRLEAVRWDKAQAQLTQRVFPTAAPPEKAPKPTPAPALVEQAAQVKSFGAGNQLTFSVTLTGEVVEIVHSDLAVFSAAGALLNRAQFPYNVQLAADRRTLQITLEAVFAPGSYQLDIPFLWKGGRSSVNVALQIT